MAEEMAMVHVPFHHIAVCLGVSKSTFLRELEHNQRLADTVEKYRSVGSNAVYDTAYKMAISGQFPAMTMFWLKCREQWREQDDAERRKDEPEVTPSNVVRLQEIARKALSA